MMTPREIIRRNLELTGPERIGMAFGGAGRMHDMHTVGLAPSRTWTGRRWTEGSMEYYDDEWGNLWARIVGMSKGGEIHEPVLRDWADVDTFRLPDMAEPYRYEGAAAALAQAGDRYRMFFLPGFPFAICRYLRKMENYFQDLILERENVDRLHERVTSLLEAVIRQCAKAGADGIFFCEDWGTQERLLVSPAMWREIFKPLFRRLCGAAHECGMNVIMHSCGCIGAIIDDLAEVGVNGLQFDQPALHGLEPLAERLQRLGVCLYAPVDIQRVLPTGDRARIEHEARRMIELFGGPRGGLIATTYGDLPGIGVQPEWEQWAYDIFAAAAANPRRPVR